MDVWQMLAALSVVLLLSVSLVANLLVLLCYGASADLRKQVSGVFVLNLTCCNLLLTLLNMPLTVVGALRNDGSRPYGEGLCRAAAFLDSFLTTNAMLSTVGLGLDRWVAVLFPLSYDSKMRRRDAAVMISYAWLHSLAFPSASLALSWLGYEPVYASCTLSPHAAPPGEERATTANSSSFVAFTLVFHGLTFFLALVVLCLTYLKVLKVARFHCKRIDIITMHTLILLVDIHPSVKERCLEEQRQRKQRAPRRVCTFIGTFALCFGPHVLTRLLELLPWVSVARPWGLFTKCLAYSKAALDPFVYSLLQRQCRGVLEGLINRLVRRDALPEPRKNGAPLPRLPYSGEPLGSDAGPSSLSPTPS
uniref:G-protein coupled receptor 26-like n=1 Tax=Myxine glutinosa TaxID=7769 RepID=UPI00358FFEBD